VEKPSDGEVPAAGTADGESGVPSLPTQGQLKARLLRLELLRGAARAVTPSIPGQPGTPPFAGVELGETLGRLMERLVDAEVEGLDPAQALAAKRAVAQELAAVDAELMVRGEELRELTDEIPLVQLRASLPTVARRRRFDVVSLLDLLIQDQTRIFERLVPFDYLITMLATEEHDGKRWVANDPVSLTPRLRFLCERAQSMYGEETVGIEQEFFAAAAPYGSHGDLNGLIARMRRRKNGLGHLTFVPGVLRAVVTYNVAISNLIEEEMLLAKLDSDHEIQGWEEFAEREFGFADESEGSADWAGSPDADAANAGSVFESPGVDAVVKAMTAGGDSASQGASAAERVVARMDVTQLDVEARAKVSPIGEGHEERVVGLSIAVGLMIRSALESSLDLRELGIDPDRLQEDWARELDEALDELVSQKVAANESEQACALSDIKTRFLYESISAFNQRNRLAGARARSGEAARRPIAAANDRRSRESDAPASRLGALQHTLGRLGARIAGKLGPGRRE
jgi:hypothetical protein